MYFAESGGVNPTTCPPATEKVPWSSPEWTPELENLPFWTATSEEVDKYKKAQAKFAPYAYTRSVAPDNSVLFALINKRFSGTTIDKYPKAKKQFAISGFSMWSPYQNPEFPDIADILPDNVKANMAAAPEHILLACKLKAFTLEASVYVLLLLLRCLDM